ncbi:MAG: hypothetical protein AB7L76_25000 [Burkholderiaceae bacterium]
MKRDAEMSVLIATETDDAKDARQTYRWALSFAEIEIEVRQDGSVWVNGQRVEPFSAPAGPNQ